MKKYISVFAVACLGGIAAIGLNKLYSKDDSKLFTQNYLARYASLSESGNRPDFVDVAQVVTPTVVHILTIVESTETQNQMQKLDDPFGFFRGPGMQMPQAPQAGSGSGVIISQDGMIVTNNHVIDGASKIKVVLNDKREYEAELIGKDANTDLALLRINEKNLPFAIVGNSDETKVGQWVLAVGNPFNLTSTVTAGIVSAKGRNLNLNQANEKRQYPIEAFIQTDAAVNPGNSGGALINTEGKLIGINTAIASETGNYAGYSFAIPSNLMQKIVSDLLKYGEAQRGVLGVEIRDVDGELADKEGLKDVSGIFINGVKPNSAAENAGIKSKDVIIAVDGKEVKSTPELQEVIGKKNPGDKVKITVLREGKERIFDVVLKNLDGKASLVKSEKAEASKFLDAKFETITRNERLKLHIQSGVKVTEINSKSILKIAGIPDGFIITTVDKNSVSTIADVKAAFEGKKGAVLVEGVNSDGSKDYFAVKIIK